jgi:uncharacterized protein (DUF58 family)
VYVTGRLPLLVAIGTVPVVTLGALGADPWAVLGLWALLCAVLVAVDVVLAASPRALRVERPGTIRTRRDVPVLVTSVLRNDGGRRIRGRLRDAWQPTAGAGAARIPFDVEAGGAQRIALGLQPRRRGELTSEFVAVRSAGPLGLAGRQAVIAARAAVRVLPPFASRRHLPSRVARLRELDGNTSVLRRGEGTEFDSLREYVRGDDVRSIDWRATARSGATMLRTWRPERDRHVVIVIDTGRTSAMRVDDGVRLDAQIEAALLLGALAAEAGDHVHVLAYDRRVRARVTRADGAALIPALADALAAVEPSLIDTDWDAAFAEARRLVPRPALVVLLTAQDEAEAARGFLGSLPALARDTRVIVGSAGDTTLTEMTRDRPDAIGAYRAASAERTLHDAARLAAAASRAGAEVVTGSAEDLPPRIADRYLRLKALGRL